MHTPPVRGSACQSRESSSRRSARFWLCLPAYTIWLPLILFPGSKVHAGPKNHAHRTERVTTIQDLVDDFRTRLSIRQEVMVSIVAENALMVSVEWLKDREGAFLLSLEEAFLRALNEEELKAVLAHELGHVWIFTHHPYLQTEALANRIAMRLVSRESLEKVYEKVWKRLGTKGDIGRFLGD